MPSADTTAGCAARPIHAVGDVIILDPIYDADKIGSIYIPDSYKNPEAQQGIVVTAGPEAKDAGIEEGQHLLFHPYRAHTFRHSGSDRVHIRIRDAVAIIIAGDTYPLPDQVMVLPEWETKYGQKSDLIYLPPTALDSNEPVKVGVIVRVGSKVERVQLNDRIIMQPGAGSEAGIIDRVYYFLKEEHILAILNNA